MSHCVGVDSLDLRDLFSTKSMAKTNLWANLGFLSPNGSWCRLVNCKHYHFLNRACWRSVAMLHSWRACDRPALRWAEDLREWKGQRATSLSTISGASSHSLHLN